MPVAQAAKMLAYFTGVVSEPTVLRTTEGADAAYVAVQTAVAGTLEQTLPPAPEGPRGSDSAWTAPWRPSSTKSEQR
jgi:hypothetical protein